MRERVSRSVSGCGLGHGRAGGGRRKIATRAAARIRPDTGARLAAAERRERGSRQTEGVEAGQFRAGLDLTPTAFAILTMCDVVIVWYRPEGRLAPEAVAGLYADLALRMATADPV